jgi:hypothetical protein
MLPDYIKGNDLSRGMNASISSTGAMNSDIHLGNLL